MQQGDFNVPYYQYHHTHPQNPNSSELHPNSLPPTYASAPPFSPNFSSSDYANYSSAYPPYPQNPESVPDLPPSAPAYSSNPNFQSFNSSVPSSAPQTSPFPSFSPAPEPQTQYPPPTQQLPYYTPYDQHQSAPNYAPSSIPNNDVNPNSSFSAPYSAPYTPLGSSAGPGYVNPYENNVKFDHGGVYFDENSARFGGQNTYGRSRSDLGIDFYEKRAESGPRYDRGGLRDDALGDGIYAYEGGKAEPYGARGTGSKSSTLSAFDDYGRSVSFSSGKDQVSSAKIVRAVPKAETEQDVKNGAQKFRVKLLPEGASLATMDVLCQIGLDGIRMLDPNTSRTLRIYPLETVTKWDVIDSSIFAFWAKSSVDIEPRRIRLQSNSYTSNTIRDTVTAAAYQLKEMGGRSKPSDSVKLSEQPTDKKKSFADWMNLVKPGNEEKDHWVPDEAATKCTSCGTDFGAFVRRHHCRNCGDIFCDKCTQGRIALTADDQAQVRVCDRCMAEVTQRLSNAKESASRPEFHSHEDLARKLQEEMEKKRKAVPGPKSEGSGRRMREVACPTCTVHLQVQVPASGSETIECGVCQHPFLVGAH